MSHPEGHASSNASAERLVTFLDAAVAIALTLLILPLMKGVAEVGQGHHVADYLHEQSCTTLINFPWLAAIVFLPVATALSSAMVPGRPHART